MSPCALGKPIGTGAVADVYAWGDGVLKLYRKASAKHDVFREAAILALVEKTGLPAPQVTEVRPVAGRWGLAMERVAGAPFAHAMLDDAALIPAHLSALARIQREINGMPGLGLPGHNARLAAKIAAASSLGEPLRARLLERLGAMPAGDRICHGDFHPLNVMGEPGAATVIDWLDATSGPPAADVCRSCILLLHHSEALARDFFDASRVEARIAAAEIAAWVPLVAAGRLSEKVDSERDLLLELASTIPGGKLPPWLR